MHTLSIFPTQFDAERNIRVQVESYITLCMRMGRGIKIKIKDDISEKIYSLNEIRNCRIIVSGSWVYINGKCFQKDNLIIECAFLCKFKLEI